MFIVHVAQHYFFHTCAWTEHSVVQVACTAPGPAEHNLEALLRIIAIASTVSAYE